MNIPAGTWLIYAFSIEGSYLQNAERPAGATCDTQQYWITDAEAWDVRTFAIDKDLRIQTLDYRGRVDDPVVYFDSVAQRTYGDIIAAHYRVNVPASASIATIRDQISQLGLHPNVKRCILHPCRWVED